MTTYSEVPVPVDDSPRLAYRSGSARKPRRGGKLGLRLNSACGWAFCAFSVFAAALGLSIYAIDVASAADHSSPATDSVLHSGFGFGDLGSPRPDIAGGEESPRTEFPAAGFIQYADLVDAGSQSARYRPVWHYCGAVLIDTHRVATAAHCVKGALSGSEDTEILFGFGIRPTLNSLPVSQLGVPLTESDGEVIVRYLVDKSSSTMHPCYAATGAFECDVAILALSGDGNAPMVTPAKIGRAEQNGEDLTGIGYGGDRRRRKGISDLVFEIFGQLALLMHTPSGARYINGDSGSPVFRDESTVLAVQMGVWGPSAPLPNQATAISLYSHAGFLDLSGESGPLMCGNGFDDDGDGMVDGIDPGCSPMFPPPPPIVLSPANPLYEHNSTTLGMGHDFSTATSCGQHLGEDVIYGAFIEEPDQAGTYEFKVKQVPIGIPTSFTVDLIVLDAFGSVIDCAVATQSNPAVISTELVAGDQVTVVVDSRIEPHLIGCESFLFSGPESGRTYEFTAELLADPTF